MISRSALSPPADSFEPHMFVTHSMQINWLYVRMYARVTPTHIILKFSAEDLFEVAIRMYYTQYEIPVEIGLQIASASDFVIVNVKW